MDARTLVGEEPALVDALRVLVAATTGVLPFVCAGAADREASEARDALTLAWVTLGRVAGDRRFPHA